jgi:WxL domain surface cell wall-binding
MRFLTHVTGRRAAALAGACAAMLWGLTGTAVLGAGAASATTCQTGAPCAITGTATLGAGTLSLTTPDSLGWTTTLNGAAAQVVDTTTADQSLTVNDARGSAAGWNVTVDATTFTSGANTLADGTTFSVNGDTTAKASTTAPDAVCTVTGDCTVPTGDTATYPLAVTTAATAPTPVTLYSAAVGTGVGSVLIGSANPIGWWLSLPGNVAAGTYTSTIDLSVASGP